MDAQMKKAASRFGRLGGNKTKAKYGREYYQRIGLLGVKAKKKKRGEPKK